jgi:hypothetical protein
MRIGPRGMPAGWVRRAFRCLRPPARWAVLLSVTFYLIAVAVQPPALKQWLGCLRLVFIAGAAVPLLRIGGVLPSRDAGIAAAAGALVIGVASVADIRRGLLGAGGSSWTGAFVFAIALIFLMYLSRAAMTCILEHFYQSRLYHRVVDQGALNGLLDELGRQRRRRRSGT